MWKSWSRGRQPPLRKDLFTIARALYHEHGKDWARVMETPLRNPVLLRRVIGEQPGFLPLAGDPELRITRRDVRFGLGAAEVRIDLLAEEADQTQVLIAIEEGRRRPEVLLTHLLAAARSLQPAARYRLVFVLMDSSPMLHEAAAQIVHLCPRVKIDLVVASSYMVAQGELLLARRLGPGSDGEDGERHDGLREWLRSVESKPGPSLTRMLAWAVELESEGLCRLVREPDSAANSTLLLALPGMDKGFVALTHTPSPNLEIYPKVLLERAPHVLETLRMLLDPGSGRQEGVRGDSLDATLSILRRAYAEAGW